MLRIIAIFILTILFIINLVPVEVKAYAWVTPSGLQSKRLSIIQEMPIKLQYINAEHALTSAKLYTDVIESKLNIGIGYNTAFGYETVTWNMEDVVKHSKQQKYAYYQYTVAQNKLSLAAAIHTGIWDSAALRAILQSGFYYQQVGQQYIREAEAVGIAMSYGRTIPISRTQQHYLYFETSLLYKMYPRLTHFERRLDVKLGLKVFRDIELALGFYRIIGLVNIPRNMHLDMRENSKAMDWRFPYISGNKLDRIYAKLGVNLGMRKFDLDLVFGGERFLQRLKGNQHVVGMARQWRRLAFIFSYNVDM